MKPKGYMAEIRQWVPDELDDELTKWSKELSKKVGFRYPKKSLIIRLLEAAIKQKSSGNSHVTGETDIAEDVRKSISAPPSGRRKNIDVSRSKKNRVADLLLA